MRLLYDAENHLLLSDDGEEVEGVYIEQVWRDPGQRVDSVRFVLLVEPLPEVTDEEYRRSVARLERFGDELAQS